MARDDDSPNEHHPPAAVDAAEIAALNDAWNALASGERPGLRGVDPRDWGAVERLHRAGRVPAARAGFIRDLEDQIMATTISIRSSDGLLPGAVREVRLRRAGNARPWTPRGVATAAATVALIAVVLAGAYAGLLAPRGGPGGATVPAAAIASPTPAEQPLFTLSPYQPVGANRWLASVVFDFPSLGVPAPSADKVRLENWTIAAGTEYGANLAGANVADGVLTDVVISGAYRVTFSTPVLINRQQPFGTGANIERVPANTEVELQPGDAVTFGLRTQLLIRNPLAQLPLWFKRVVIYTGDYGAPGDIAGGRTTARIDGEGALAMPLSAFPQEPQILLAYFQELPGYPVPEAMGPLTRVIGPVATIQGNVEVPDSGFFVYVGVTQG